jgi:serine/threonine-protein kinase RsbW
MQGYSYDPIHEGALVSRSAFDVLFDSSLESVDTAEEKVNSIATGMGFPEEDIFRLGMAVREAMVNAVVHGNRYSANKKVHLVVLEYGRQIEVRISDQGNGFVPSEQPDPLAQENILKQSGRGVMLIRAFVDEFVVQPAQPTGTEVILRKSLPAEAAPGV